MFVRMMEEFGEERDGKKSRSEMFYNYSCKENTFTRFIATSSLFAMSQLNK
jgi:hypothetical protein